MVAGEGRTSPPLERDEGLEGLSEEDRAFVREARRLLTERKGKPPISDEIQRRMDSESGVEVEGPPERD
jgi:hypothetical protein